jgi:hypothetical protein
LPGSAGARTVVVVPEFVAEMYVSRTNVAALARDAENARLAADELTRQGAPVTFLDSIFVPDDETCFYLYRAASADAVWEAAARAGIRVEHLGEAVRASREKRPRSGRGRCVPGATPATSSDALSGTPGSSRASRVLHDKTVCGRKGAQHG